MIDFLRRVFSLRIKLLITVVGVVLLFLSISTYFQIKQTGQIIHDQIKDYGNSMSRALADFCIEDLLSWNYPSLQLYVDYIGEQDPQIKGIKIYHNDAIIAEYCSERDNMASCDSELAGVFTSPVIFRVNDEERYLGKVEFYMSKARYEDFLSGQIRLLWILSAVLLIGDTFLSYWTVKVLILNPLRKIVEGTKTIGGGNLRYRIEISNKDEIGVLAQTINNMARRLRTSYESMAKQTENLKKVKNTLITTLNETESAKKKIEEERNKTFAIISNLVDPVIVIGDNQKIILVNPSAKKTLGIQDDDINKELTKSDCAECLPKRLCLCDFKKIIRVPYVSRVLKTNELSYPIIEELIIGNSEESQEVLSNGNRKVFKVLTSEVKDIKGKAYGHMKIFYDLTQEKIIDEMKSEFVSIAAHQLRTPSAGVKWALDMIMEGEMGEIPDEAKEYIGRAAEANEIMVKLVKDLLNVSYIETGKFIYKFDKINLKDVINEVIDSSNITAIQKNVQLVSEFSEEEISEVVADREKIKQAIQNIVNNAIKYSESDSNVTVKLLEEQQNPNYVDIIIEDEGIGISSEDIKKLFSKFYRGENAKRLETEGSGLGLFITKNIIEAHGGKISCESVMGEKTAFKLSIPIKREEKKDDDIGLSQNLAG